MRNLRLDICYDGTRYKGWQRLAGSDQTIQGKLEQVLSRMLGEPIEISGSGSAVDRDSASADQGDVAHSMTVSGDFHAFFDIHEGFFSIAAESEQSKIQTVGIGKRFGQLHRIFTQKIDGFDTAFLCDL